MDLVIIPDLTLMNAVKYKEASFSQAKDCRTSFNYASEICIKNNSKIKIVLPEQIIQKIGFNDEQRTALEPICIFDKTTLSVNGQTPKNCIVETANTWLVKKVIVIHCDSIKLKFENDVNLRVVSPKDFIKKLELAKTLYQLLNEKNLDQIIIDLFFKEDALAEFVKKVKKIHTVTKK